MLDIPLGQGNRAGRKCEPIDIRLGPFDTGGHASTSWTDGTWNARDGPTERATTGLSSSRHTGRGSGRLWTSTWALSSGGTVSRGSPWFRRADEKCKNCEGLWLRGVRVCPGSADCRRHPICVRYAAGHARSFAVFVCRSGNHAVRWHRGRGAPWLGHGDPQQAQGEVVFVGGEGWTNDATP